MVCAGGDAERQGAAARLGAERRAVVKCATLSRSVAEPGRSRARPARHRAPSAARRHEQGRRLPVPTVGLADRARRALVLDVVRCAPVVRRGYGRGEAPRDAAGEEIVDHLPVDDAGEGAVLASQTDARSAASP